MLRGLLVSVTVAYIVATSPALAGEPTEANLRAADAEQMRIIVEKDAK